MVFTVLLILTACTTKDSKSEVSDPANLNATLAIEKNVEEKTNNDSDKVTRVPTVAVNDGNNSEISNAQNNSNPTEEPVASITEEPISTIKEQPTSDITAIPTEEVTEEPAIDKNAENLVGYYKMTSVTSQGTTMSQDYFDIYEKYGIFLSVIYIQEDGYAYFYMMGQETNQEKELYTYDDTFFTNVENGSELVYVLKNGELTLVEASILGNVKATFVRMTDDEIAIWEKGYSAEDFKSAEQEAMKLLENDEQLKNDKYLSYIEKSRRAQDEMEYSALVSYSQFAVTEKDIIEILSAGHSYRVIMTKEGTKVLLDDKEVTEEDPFYKLLEQFYWGDFTDTINVKASNVDEYIIDIGSDLTITQTKAPEKTSDE